MQTVIDHDKIVYDKRNFDMSKHLRNLNVKSISIKEENIHQAEEDDRVLKVYEKLISRIDSENKERQ